MRIMARAGHKDMDSTLGYVSKAALVGQAYGEPFPALPACLLATSSGLLGGRYAMEALLADASAALAEDDTEGLRRLLLAALSALSLPLDTAAGAR